MGPSCSYLEPPLPYLGPILGASWGVSWGSSDPGTPPKKQPQSEPLKSHTSMRVLKARGPRGGGGAPPGLSWGFLVHAGLSWIYLRAAGCECMPAAGYLCKLSSAYVWILGRVLGQARGSWAILGCLGSIFGLPAANVCRLLVTCVGYFRPMFGSWALSWGKLGALSSY